jgi:hypothetical protein
MNGSNLNLVYVLSAIISVGTVAYLFSLWRQYAYRVKWNGILESPVVCAAARFWQECLCRDFSPALTDAELEEFYQDVRLGITKEMMKEGLVVSMGMTERRQHGFIAVPDLDSILKVASLQLSYSRQVRIDLASYLPMIEMRIYDDKVKIRQLRVTGRFEDFYELYKTGDKLDIMVDWAQAHRLPEPRDLQQLL